MKKSKKLPTDIDLDIPPEPPKIGIEKEISAKGPIDEELIVPKKKELKAPKIEEELPEIPPLPKIEPSPKRGFFPFFKPKKAAEKLPLPKVEEELPEIPPLPKVEEELPKIPPLPKVEEKPPEKPPITPPITPIPTLKPMPKVEAVEKPIIKPKFITINNFRQIQDDITSAKGSLKGTDALFAELEDNRAVGNKECSIWHDTLQDIHKKIMFIDKTLFE